MKSIYNAASVPPLRSLSLFPEPYPGESFYSVLSRYHVRSGNISSHCTREELFGLDRHPRLYCTILAPAHLQQVCMSVPESSGITMSHMLQENTAFPLFSITAPKRTLITIRKEISLGRDICRHLPHMQSSLIHHSGRLRFCPECARIQQLLYGEPYWQILPQLEGIEYCPIHQLRIIDSDVTVAAARSSFIPASYAITAHQKTGMRQAMVEEESIFEKEKTFFINTARSCLWLMANAHKVESYTTLFLAYQNLLGGSFYGNWTTSEPLKELFLHSGVHEQIYTYIISQAIVKRFGANGTQHVELLPLSAHIMLMTAISGTPDVFYGVNSQRGIVNL